MNKLRNYIGLIVSLLVFLPLLGGSLFFFWQAWSGMKKERGELETARSNYQSLIRKDPFPNQANLEQVRKNADFVSQTYTNTIVPRADHYIIQIDTNITQNTFLGEVSNQLNALVTKAEKSFVVMPPNFNLGFRSYVQGGVKPGDPSYIPHLLKQLTLSSFLVERMIDNEVIQISEVSRLMFEGSGGSAMDDTEMDDYGSGLAMAPMMMGMGGAQDPLMQPIGSIEPDPSGKYLEYPFRLVFITRTRSLRAFMNALVHPDTPYFFVVKELTVASLTGVEQRLQLNRSARELSAPRIPGQMGLGTGTGATPGYRSPGGGYPGGGYPGGGYPGYSYSGGSMEGFPPLGDDPLQVQMFVSACDFFYETGDESY